MPITRHFLKLANNKIAALTGIDLTQMLPVRAPLPDTGLVIRQHLIEGRVRLAAHNGVKLTRGPVTRLANNGLIRRPAARTPTNTVPI